jgi:hypothetical protein
VAGIEIRGLPGAASAGCAGAIALGFACGAFVSFTPLFGFHYLLAIALAWALRGSVIASFLGANLGWFYPFVLVWTYELGTRIMGASGKGSLPPHLGSGYLLHHPWSVFLPTMIGSLPVAPRHRRRRLCLRLLGGGRLSQLPPPPFPQHLGRRGVALEEYRP